jgi:hypothetical protein
MFKFYIIVNECGELLSFKVTKGNTNDKLKNISDIEHSRHRSSVDFALNWVAGLISCTWKEKKPSITKPQMHGVAEKAELRLVIRCNGPSGKNSYID